MATTEQSTRHLNANGSGPPPTMRVTTTDLDAVVTFFVDEIGFHHHLVTPADSPRRVELDGYGVRLDIRRADSDRPVALVLPADLASEVASHGEVREGPGGSTVEFVDDADRRVGGEPVIPPAVPELHVSRRDAGDGFGVGRAAMHYRDLLPSRWGGRFIASHIAIPEGGELSDWVHFHRIRFQMIYVMSGWVDVVYEDQGPAFRMEAGDCVLQPPTIRHRVLRASPGLDVIEIGCPAEHDTFADRDVALPTAGIDPGRDFSGQRFVRHQRSTATSEPLTDGWRRRTIGFAPATDGLAEAWVAHGDRGATVVLCAATDAEFVSVIVTAGAVDVAVAAPGTNPESSQESNPESSQESKGSFLPGEALFVPGGTRLELLATMGDSEVLVVELPSGAVLPSGTETIAGTEKIT